MQIAGFRIPHLPTKVFVILGILVWVFTPSDVIAYYEATYAESAHGDPISGVNRSTATCEHWPDETCVTGSCAHCHDTFDPNICENDPNGLMLFAPNNPTSQTDNFCFQCHKSDGAAQHCTNYTYSKNFGGGDITFTTIYDAFNPTTGDTPSSHNLSDISQFVAGHSGFTADTNPCVVCHDPHTAQENYPVTLSGLGGVKTAIRRVAHYQDLRSNLWGDENLASSGYLERMRDATNNYQAPLRVDSGYEPRGDTTPEDQNGSYTPNFATFCVDCHGYSTVPSTERGRYLYKIDFSASGDFHGLNHQGGDSGGASKAPYIDHDYNYVLSCTDCHEPHGSENEWLLRTCVNGTEVTVPGPGRYWYFCQACHTLNQHFSPFDDTRTCSGCHNHSYGGQFF